jgi:RimJ/RimL family protein N-acetyltransferase
MSGYVNPILFDFPDTFETERLIIRAPRPGDGAEVQAAVLESINELRPWMPWAQTPPTIEEAEISIRNAIAHFQTREDLRLNLYRKSDGLFVGGSGLHRIDWAVPRFEIGYWVRTSLQGQGYITEAVLGITDFAFNVLGAQRMEIRCDARNERSAAVARRAGYQLDACLRNNGRDVNGDLCDTLIFSKLPEKDQGAL